MTNLILDLDHTLISTITMSTYQDDYDNSIKPDLIFSEPPYNRYIYRVFLRPYLHDFLEEMHTKYKLILYTNAQQYYTDRIIDHIGRHYFTEIICRTSSAQTTIKTTSMVRTFSPTKMLIIDDRVDTWDYEDQHNVYKIKRFNMEVDHGLLDSDEELNKMKDALVFMHRLSQFVTHQQV